MSIKIIMIIIRTGPVYTHHLCYVDPENECESIAVVDSPTEHP